jgi:hypothetical protein
MVWRILRLGTVVALVAALLLVPAAGRAAAGSVTLDASPAQVTFGDDVALSGVIDPAAGGETVEIRDASDSVVASATTAGDGTYWVAYAPDANVDLHAAWSGAESPPVTVEVRPVVTTTLRRVRLFDRALVGGSVSPLRPGEEVEVELRRGGATVATRTVAIGPAGGFHASFRIARPGTYRARARFSAPDLLASSDASSQRETPLPSLEEGDRSPFVRLLEGRLRELDYHLVGADRAFDFRTADAVLAFRKVNRMARNFRVTSAVWRALVSARRYVPDGPAKGFYIDVDKSLQVLATVRDGEVLEMIHVSTGADATPTPVGWFRVRRKIAGYSPNRLYYPSYFYGNVAIHGWPEVPVYNASHGCVRVPYWTAKWIFGLAPIRTRVVVHW